MDYFDIDSLSRLVVYGERYSFESMGAIDTLVKSGRIDFAMRVLETEYEARRDQVENIALDLVKAKILFVQDAHYQSAAVCEDIHRVIEQISDLNYGEAHYRVKTQAFLLSAKSHVEILKGKENNDLEGAINASEFVNERRLFLSHARRSAYMAGKAIQHLGQEGRGFSLYEYAITFAIFSEIAVLENNYGLAITNSRRALVVANDAYQDEEISIELLTKFFTMNLEQRKLLEEKRKIH